MRKVILAVAISADGFIEGLNGEYDWCFSDPDYNLHAFFKRIDTIFVGRKTYEMSSQMEGALWDFQNVKNMFFQPRWTT